MRNVVKADRRRYSDFGLYRCGRGIWLIQKADYVTSGKKVDDRQVAIAHTRSRKDSKADFDRIEKVYQFLLAYMDQLGTAPKK